MENNGMIKALIRSFQTAQKDLVAFSLYDGEKVTDITYRQFAEDILKAAGYFAANHITGANVAIAAPGSYRWGVVFFALAVNGNTIVPLNQDLPEEMLRWQCQKAGVSLVCYENPETAERIGLTACVSFDKLDTEEALLEEKIYLHGMDETILMMFTSGTTGASKAVVLSTRNLFSSADNLFHDKKSASVPEAETILLSLPLYHIGSVRTLLSQLSLRHTMAIGRGPRYVFMDMPKLNPTHVGMVPSMAESLAKIMRRTPADKMLNYVGSNFKGIIAVGASMKSSVAKYLLEKGVQIEILYGMTESAGDGSWCVLDDAHIGTIGKPDGNIDIKIEDGEILLRSDAVMKGYYNDPEETAKVIVDGWLHTGDMGCCDEDGYYYITGRKKNVIILSNGENVNPEEIEATFSECEDIEECLVYSDGKGICADVFASNQEKVEAFIKNYNESMPMYRQVYKVNYTAEPLPKTGSGKIKRKENK